MERGRNRWVIRLAVVVVAAAGMLVWALQARGGLTISNQSGQKIVILKLTAAEQTIILRDLAVGADETVPFVVKANDPAVLEGNLADGRLIRVQGPAGDWRKLVILPNGEVKINPRMDNQK